MRNFQRKCSLRAVSFRGGKNTTGKQSLLFGSLDTAVNFKKVLQPGKTINNSRCRGTLFEAPCKRTCCQNNGAGGGGVCCYPSKCSAFTTNLSLLNPDYLSQQLSTGGELRGRSAFRPIMCDFLMGNFYLVTPSSLGKILTELHCSPRLFTQFSSHILSFLKCLQHQLEALAAHL